MNNELTKDADTLICVMYDAYLERRKQGVNKEDAMSFGGAEDIQDAFVPKWSVKDIVEVAGELDQVGYMSCFYAEDTFIRLNFESKGIVYMENRFKNGIKEFLEYFDKIKP